MKVVVNKKFGGFGLSPLATKMLAKKKGKECYFFEICYPQKEYKELTLEQAEDELMWFAYSVPNPQDYDLDKPDEDGRYKSANERAEKISIESRPEDRSDKDLIDVVEQLGEKANTRFSNLVIVEIPDDVEWEVDDYDGMETIREKHRTW